MQGWDNFSQMQAISVVLGMIEHATLHAVQLTLLVQFGKSPFKESIDESLIGTRLTGWLQAFCTYNLEEIEIFYFIISISSDNLQLFNNNM